MELIQRTTPTLPPTPGPSSEKTPKHYKFTPKPSKKLPRAWDRKPSTPFAPRTETQKIWKRYELHEVGMNATARQAGPRNEHGSNVRAVKRLRPTTSPLGDDGDTMNYIGMRWDVDTHIAKHKPARTVPFVSKRASRQAPCDSPQSGSLNGETKETTTQRETRAMRRSASRVSLGIDLTEPLTDTKLGEPDRDSNIPSGETAESIVIALPSHAPKEDVPETKEQCPDQDLQLLELLHCESSCKLPGISDVTASFHANDRPLDQAVTGSTSNDILRSGKSSVDPVSQDDLPEEVLDLGNQEQSKSPDLEDGHRGQNEGLIKHFTNLQKETVGRADHEDGIPTLLPSAAEVDDNSGERVAQDADVFREIELGIPTADLMNSQLDIQATREPLMHAPEHHTDDAEYLHEFLTRARAKRAEAAPVPSRTKKEHTPMKNPANPAGPSQSTGSRTPLEILDRNSSSPRKTKKAGMQGETKAEPSEEKESSPCRRSNRTRLPRPQRPPAPAPNNIPVRRSNGSEFVFLQRTEAQDIASTTRSNTKRNKGEAVMPKMKLRTLSTQGQTSPAKPARMKKSNKIVSWDEKLADFGDEQEQKVRKNSLEFQERERRPRAKKLRHLGAANGTPAPKKILPEKNIVIDNPVSRKKTKAKD